MDGGATGGNAGVIGSSGPAPFVIKTYEMVDDSRTDAIVSWSGSWKSFIVWNPPEFARVLLPSYFKHNNFSSFIRQLNTYGFRKIDPERWEFANDDFVKDQKHLLKNIYRRKPIHSHSQPEVDPERVAFEEEIDKLSTEKSILERNVLRYNEQQSTAKIQLQNLTQRINFMETRQEKLLGFLVKAVQNPEFVEKLTQKLESMELSAYKKKRRIPQEDQSLENHSNNLTLELSPAGSDVILFSHSTQSSNEDEHAKTAGLELSDSGVSFNLNADSPLSGCESPYLQLGNPDSNDEGDDRLSCLLNLTLASSSVELAKDQNPIESSQDNTSTVCRLGSNADDRTPDNPRISSSSRDVRNNKTPAAFTTRVNDVFWEQFLTERPGCSDEETGPCPLVNSYKNNSEHHLSL